VTTATGGEFCWLISWFRFIFLLKKDIYQNSTECAGKNVNGGGGSVSIGNESGVHPYGKRL
jgi:hypothetical protein